MVDKSEKNKILGKKRGDSADNESAESRTVSAIPSVKYYDMMYGRSFEGNDRKAVHTFKLYESQERLRRLQNELQQVKQGKVTEKVCDLIIGKKRLSKFESYEHWAQLMLHWIAEKKL